MIIKIPGANMRTEALTVGQKVIVPMFYPDNQTITQIKDCPEDKTHIEITLSNGALLLVPRARIFIIYDGKTVIS